MNVHNQLFGRYLLNRYIETGQFNAVGAHGRARSVLDTLLDRGDLVMKSTRDPEVYRRELPVLHAMRGFAGFPLLYDYFTTPPAFGDVEYCFVTDYGGECIDDIARRSGGRFSHSNIMRISFQLLWALETLHQRGFVHRDVHCGNVLLRREFDGVVRLKIIDFGLSLPRYPLPYPEINMTSWHASLQVCRGEAYSRFDDLISAIFLPMWFIPVDPFGGVRAEYLQKKITFDANPHSWFPEELEWIADLYTEVNIQRTSGFSHTDLFDFFYRTDPEFDPTSPIVYRVENNQLILE
ncbi:unnamed protein product [Caenorhabditis nigoni]|uniref:Protein kinase domain-containing protein n=1 Tax=Caenorhabditis nigoni TaxID=1611254 RepID=A0A2G5SM99_9PELO|nr:hypothetical protein B9Z55_022851 [Caenorhabditis nigoni]PIC16157.1 hypothetical protein B9Z55_022856 [Caenorhabditis nigoni]